MATQNHQRRESLSILVVTLLLLSAVVACGPGNDTDTNTSTPATTTTTPGQQTPGTMSLLGTHLDTLILDSTSYGNLRGKFPPSIADKTKLVLQFEFDNSRAKNPSAIAYASKPGNRFRFGTVTNPFSIVLTPAGQAFQLPNRFVLGDQQIRFEDIDGIIGGSTDFVLYFIPTIRTGEINVRYNVCIRKGNGAVVCLAPPPATQPSPPANAS